MSIKTLILGFIMLLLVAFPSVCHSQSNCEQNKFSKLRVLIEKNFHFLDTSTASKKNDFAVLRIERVSDTINVEFMSFNNVFDNSLKALKDSIIKKWKPAPGFSKDIYIPLKFVFNDEQLNPHQNVNEAFEINFNKNKQKSPTCIWVKPIILIKFDRTT